MRHHSLCLALWGKLYNQMNHLFDRSLREIVEQLLHRIQFIGIRDFLVRANLPKCFDEIIRGKGILELCCYMSVVPGTLRAGSPTFQILS